MRLVPLVASAMAAKPTGPMRSAALLLLIVIVVLGSLLVGVALVVIANRQRRQRTNQNPNAELPDPWKESARRMQTSSRDESAE